ncbi:MAG: hypothetical protein LAT62_05400 [Natronospirillum sp.]|uniref:sensor histidine kinase n=1 Tax=Natronospirillum sp. TaxID=2812955 RepID=UPI0025CE180C|nr:ATP-binding protein [Natronospirillum sp.]MCH8551351.1 hypothetical protein [Natronospirillum sp.]
MTARPVAKPAARKASPAITEIVETDAESRSRNYSWRLLMVLNLYRLIVAGACVFLAGLSLLPDWWPNYLARLFYEVGVLYLLLGTLIIWPLVRRKPSLSLQLLAGVLLDVAAMVVLIYASGGVDGGVALLLMISIIGASLISEGRMALFFASIGTLAILVQEVYVHWNVFSGDGNFPVAGLMGMALFAVAALAHVLGRRSRLNEALAAQRGLDLANMAQLTDYVIQQMDTGIVVLDIEGRVRLINRAARHLLQIEGRPRELRACSTELARAVRQWVRQDPGARRRHLINAAQHPLLVQYRRIGSGLDQSALIFMDDAAATAEQAQQLKLVAWGRLTASLAHEVRNPLGAIGHAAALLAESTDLATDDKRLVSIVQEHTGRINRLIENVMQLGKRDRHEPQKLTLNQFLPRFLRSFNESQGVNKAPIQIISGRDTTLAWCDPSHLQQILTNLCQNAVRHAGSGGEPRIRIAFGRLQDEQVYVDVLDNGPGVSPDRRKSLFRPFFTTQPEGTGLGLYLSRELAQANQGDLQYREPAHGGACFRVTLKASQEESLPRQARGEDRRKAPAPVSKQPVAGKTTKTEPVAESAKPADPGSKEAGKAGT